MGLQETKIESLPFVTAELNYLAPTSGKPLAQIAMLLSPHGGTGENSSSRPPLFEMAGFRSGERAARPASTPSNPPAVPWPCRQSRPPARARS